MFRDLCLCKVEPLYTTHASKSAPLWTSNSLADDRPPGATASIWSQGQFLLELHEKPNSYIFFLIWAFRFCNRRSSIKFYLKWSKIIIGNLISPLYSTVEVIKLEEKYYLLPETNRPPCILIIYVINQSIFPQNYIA